MCLASVINVKTTMSKKPNSSTNEKESPLKERRNETSPSGTASSDNMSESSARPPSEVGAPRVSAQSGMNAQMIPDWQAMYSSMYRPHEGIRPDEERRGGLVNPLVASPSSQSSTSEPFLDPRELSQQQLQQIIDARQAASMALSNPYMLAQLSMGANMPAAAASMSDFQAALLMSAANNNVPTGTLPFQGGFPMNMTTFGQSSFLAGAGLSAAQIQPVGNLNVPVASNYTALRGGRVADSNTSVASTISEKDHPAMTGITRGILEPFPERLHRLLSEVEAAGLSHIISFTEDGQAFKIHKPEEFFRRIVQVYFKQTRLSSFKRQLNLCK